MIIKCLKACKLFIVTNKLTIIQLICVLFMICNGLLLILDYLKFDYELKLIISKNDRGIDLPAIDICTENNVLFDKRKILKLFDLDRYYSQIEHKLKLHNYCSYYCRPKYKLRYSDSLLFYFDLLSSCCNKYSKHIHNKLIAFIEKFEQMIFAHLSYEQMISLTLSGPELFECRASVHLKNQTIGSNQTIIDNCFQVFPIFRHIYANNDFGICYKLFDNNNQIRIENNDSIEIKIKNEMIKNLKYSSIFYYSADGDTNRQQNRDNVFTIPRNHFQFNLILKTMSFEMLSIPFMQLCERKGKQNKCTLYRL